MATVEEIYRKIRRGETADLKSVRVSDSDLASGIERIRDRLSGKNSETITSPRPLVLRPQIWLPALAALCLIAFFFWPKSQQPLRQDTWAAGSIKQFGSVEIKALTNSRYSENFTGNKLILKLDQGMLLLTRRDHSTELTVVTPEGALSAQGTIFLVEFEKKTSVRLIEGRLLLKVGTTERILDKENNAVGRDLRSDAAPYQKEPRRQSFTPPVAQSAFNAGDCVVYYRNNEKRRGKIYAHDASGYTIRGSSGPEPGRFRDGDFFRADCAE